MVTKTRTPTKVSFVRSDENPNLDVAPTELIAIL